MPWRFWVERARLAFDLASGDCCRLFGECGFAPILLGDFRRDCGWSSDAKKFCPGPPTFIVYPNRLATCPRPRFLFAELFVSLIKFDSFDIKNFGFL